MFPQQAGERPVSLSLSEQHVPGTYHLKARKHELSADPGFAFLACNGHHKELVEG